MKIRNVYCSFCNNILFSTKEIIYNYFNGINFFSVEYLNLTDSIKKGNKIITYGLIINPL